MNFHKESKKKKKTEKNIGINLKINIQNFGCWCRNGTNTQNFYTLYFGNFKNHTHYITIVTRETQTNIKNGLKANTPHKKFKNCSPVKIIGLAIRSLKNQYC